MASPQLEEGYLKVAFSLSAALAQAGFSGLELSILITIMNLTYGRNQTKAEMSVDDIRYMLGTHSNTRSDRVAKALQGLLDKQVIFRQNIDEERFILGLQKDYEKWGLPSDFAKMANHDDIYINNNTNKTTWDAKMAVPEKFLRYVGKLSGVNYSNIKVRSMELSRATTLYQTALQKYRSVKEAAEVLKDYADYVYEEEWVRNNVKMPLAYMGRDFDRFLKVLPKKPKYVQEQEILSGKRQRYNLRTKKWGTA